MDSLLKKIPATDVSGNSIVNKKELFSSGYETESENKKFFSIVSHNIKNPFSTLLGFTELLFEDFDQLDDTEKKFYLNEIKKSANYTYRYIEKFFEWIYYKTGKIKLEFQAINVNRTINKIVETFTSNSKIIIENNIDKNLTVYADLYSFEKIFYNLIENGIKFSEPNTKIELFGRKLNNKIEISVKDNGTGISKNDIKNLFDISIDPTLIGSNKNKGTGLGLILTKELIILNNGIITVESSPGKGSTFSVTLPKN